MPTVERRAASRRLTVLIGAVALVAACSAETPVPSGGPSADPSVSPRPTATVAPSPSATASAPVSAGPSPVPTTAEACPVETQTGRLPSDRMTDVRIDSGSGGDRVTFVFGNPSSPTPPQGPSDGLLEIAEPPFVEGASGLPMDIDGERVVFVRFTGMTLVNDVGQPTYDGPTEFAPDGAVLRTVANSEQFEGVVSWYIGFDGPGCVTLSSDARSVTVSIEAPAAWSSPGRPASAG
jgi:hypothetical protein